MLERDIVQGRVWGLYIHWPYCAKICPYCDFNRKLQRDLTDSAWKEAVVADLHYSAAVEMAGGDSRIASVFFGGGTPSLAEVAVIADIIAEIRKIFTCTDDLEVTLEANPTSVEAGKFAEFAASGVNRLSLGVQSLRDDALQYLGRNYDAEAAKAAIAVAQRHFPRVNLDFIYGRTAEDDIADWLAELREVCAYDVEHLSLYQLTLEPGTAFYRQSVPIPSAERAARLFEASRDLLARYDYNAYEVSNFCKANAECRHNLIYWHYGLYAGIGAGAHGRVGGVDKKHATERPKSPLSWAKLSHLPAEDRPLPAPLPRKVRFTEKLMMGLRLYGGVAVESLQAESADDCRQFLSSSGLHDMVESGYIAIENDRVSATASGILCLNSVLERLCDAT